MRKILFAAAAILALSAAPALAQNGGNGQGNNCQGNSCGGFGNTGFGAAAGAFGGSGSFTLTGSFARNQQSGFGMGYAQTETTANAGSGLQAGTNVPFGANGFANTSSLSQSGSRVEGGNGSVSNLTGGFGISGTALGGGFGARAR